MNTKRIFLLVIMFFLLMLVSTSNVFATDTMPDELKQILNEEGKLVITDTTMAEDKLKFLNEYVNEYKPDGEKKLQIKNYSEENSTCDIVISDTDKTYNVEIVYEEKISDDFKTILKDGKVQVPSSTKNGVFDKLKSYFERISELNENDTFNVATYQILNEEESTEEDPIYDDVGYINENCTKVTIQMRNKSWTLLEQHTVELSYLTEKSDAFKEALNKDGKIVFNSVKPNNEDEMRALFQVLVAANNEEKGYEINYPSEDYSSIDITINSWTDKEETHRVEIEYNYDKKTDKKFQGFRKNFPENIEYFYVKDLELINYWINNVENDDIEHLDAYSGELKKAVNNNNVKYYVHINEGINEPFYAQRAGIAVFSYNNVIYHINTSLGTKAENIIYVPNGTGNTKEELMEAAQKRIDKYLGKVGIATATISYAGTAKEAWCKAQYERDCFGWKEENPNMTVEEWIMTYMSEYEDFGREKIEIDGVKEEDYSFIIKVKVGDKEKSFNVLIQRDSSKMVNPTYKTIDMNTDIEINSEDSSIPLDTHIKAEKLTNGKEYERILKILDLKDNEMFDLKLYSDSLEDYITKLPNGEFEVRIPISEDFKHKDLKAYYVDENGKVEKYDITKKDGYAIFRTNHFSIYTLAEEKVEIYSLTLDANEGEFSDGKTKIEFEDVTKCDMTKVEKPVKDGYTFKGWFTKKTGGESIETVMSSEDGIKADMTFYAQWEEMKTDDNKDEENTNTNTGNTDSGNTNTGNTNNNKPTGNNPQTGDNIVMFTVISLIAFVGIAVAIKVKKYVK